MEGGWPNGHSPKMGNARSCNTELITKFLIRRFASKDFLQAHGCPTHLGDFVYQVNRQTNCFRLVRKCAFDGLFDPPDAVGRELAALRWVEALNGLHESNVALVNKIKKGKAETFIIMRDLHNKAKVCINHYLPSF